MLRRLQFHDYPNTINMNDVPYRHIIEANQMQITTFLQHHTTTAHYAGDTLHAYYHYMEIFI